MLYACLVYIVSEPIGLNLGLNASTYIISLAVGVAILVFFFVTGNKQMANLAERPDLTQDHLPIGTFSK